MEAAINVLYTEATGRDLELSTAVADIVPGTVVRVVWQRSGLVSGTMDIDFGGTNEVSLAVNTAAEFVFYVVEIDSVLVGKWLVTQCNVPTRF